MTDAAQDEARARAIAHRDMEIALVGDRDPADVQTELLPALEAAVKCASDRLWARRAPDEWSVGEIVTHLADVEIFVSARYRWILAHDEPPLVGFSQEALAEHLHGEGHVNS